MAYQSIPRALSRADVMTLNEGVFAETIPRMAVSAALALTGGTVYLVALPLLAGDLVASLSAIVATASPGVAVTLSKLGLYDKLGNRLAVSADQGASWETAGVKTVAMGTPYLVPRSDVYYAAVVANGGTVPGFSRASTQGTSQSLSVNGGAMPNATMAGQTDLPASVTLAASGGLPIWIGAS